MKKNRTRSKIAEIFFSSGIPIVAFAKFANNTTTFIDGIPILLAIVATGGWHIKTINDQCEEHPKRIKLTASLVIPLLLIPALLYFKPNTAIPIVLIVLNWDFYSIFGKKYFFLSMVNNFWGGFLHFALGLTMAGIPFTNSFSSSTTFFFGFAMLCGSMHHDAYHVTEDKEHKFFTGAVRFNPEIWWKLAVFPMIIAIFFLIQDENIFLRVFLPIAILPYLIGYFTIILLSPRPSKIIFFRLFCRLSFGLATLTYILLKIFYHP